MDSNRTPSSAAETIARAKGGRSDLPDLDTRSYDHWHVDLHEKWEIDFWMKHLGCDEDGLRDAVFEVGARVGAVRAYLASHPKRR